MKKPIKIIAGVATIGLLLSACSSYDRGELIAELEEAGIDESAATCIVNGAEEKIGEDRLGSRGDPTDEETGIMAEITLECLTGS